MLSNPKPSQHLTQTHFKSIAIKIMPANLYMACKKTDFYFQFALHAADFLYSKVIPRNNLKHIYCDKYY